MSSTNRQYGRWPLIVVIASLFLVLLSGSPLMASHHEKTTSSDVKEETAEAYTAIKNYTVEQRDEALAYANDKVSQLDRKIDSLQNDLDRQWAKMSEATREKKQATLQALRQKRNDVAEWLGGLKHSSANAWDEVKAGFADSMDRLQSAFQDASKEFNDDK